MDQQSGARISQKAFLQSLLILFILMMTAGLLTRVVPAGRYQRVQELDREVIDPSSFTLIERPNYPVWRWFTAPLEVPFAEGGLTVIIILIFLFFIGGSFAVLEKSGIIKAMLGRVVQRYAARKYTLLYILSLLFMLMGAFFGIFEEVVPLVPVMIALSYSLGWDALVGLGMSILATNLGFSAAITNPFTIGVAQKLAGLPLFSGFWLRGLIFVVIYLLLILFLGRYARQIDRQPDSSLTFGDDSAERAKYRSLELETFSSFSGRYRTAAVWFLLAMVLILLTLVASPFLPALSDYSLPLVGILFLIGSVGAGLLSGAGGRLVWRGLLEGMAGILPAVPLILMAVSIKHIVVSGGIMDTLLHNAAQPFQTVNPFMGVAAVYVLALLIEFFVASGSAKAFLLMPILLPLADLIGVTRQTTVLAYCFGDGFSNLAYPTNPVLLIALGLTVVSYPKWMRWTAKLWLWVVLVTIAFLGLAVAIRFGPF